MLVTSDWDLEKKATSNLKTIVDGQLFPRLSSEVDERVMCGFRIHMEGHSGSW